MNHSVSVSILGLLVPLSVGCSSSTSANADTSAVQPAPQPDPQPDPQRDPRSRPNKFTDVTAGAGLDFQQGTPVSRFGGGVAAADYDRDGWVDLFFLRGAAFPPLLYRNLGDGSFAEVSVAAGLSFVDDSCGASFADIDGDRFPDLVTCGTMGTKPKVFLNQKDGTFRDVTSSTNLTAYGDTTCVAFGDYDRDGDVDLFMTRWQRDGNPTTDEHLWRNNGDMTFTDVTASSGVGKSISVVAGSEYSFTPNFADIDNDGWSDLLIAADFNTSRVFLNKKDGTFEDITTSTIADENGMGAAIGDYDNDGDLDWFVSSIWEPDPRKTGYIGNKLYRNRGDGVFDDVTGFSGTLIGYWGWGASFHDFDNDGHLDLVHTNGWFEDYEHDPTRLFMSNGNGTFAERSLELDLVDLREGRGVVCFDYDHDGDVDVLIHNQHERPQLFRNDLITGRYLTVRLEGRAPNTEALGARVYLTTGPKTPTPMTQMREVRRGSNYMSQNPMPVHFGLGDATEVDLRVVWPDGSETTQSGVVINQSLVIRQ